MPSLKSVASTKSANSKSRIRRMRSRKKRKSDTLQQTIGNQAVGRMIQAKLSIGKPDDTYEREADHVADKVMRMSEPASTEDEETAVQAKTLANQITPLVQRAPEEQPNEDESLVQTMTEETQDEDEEEPIQTKLSIQRQTTEEDEEPIQAKIDSGYSPYLQRQIDSREEEETLQTKSLHTTQFHGNRTHIQPKAVRPAASQASSAVAANVNALKGGGQPLPQPTRAFFETRFGRDFREIRIHTGSGSEEIAKSINARAFTVRRDIAFGAGQYSPETNEGKKLLAHELTHVVQQNKNMVNKKEENPVKTKPDPKAARRKALLNDFTRGWNDLPEKIKNRIRGAMKAFSLKQLDKMNKAGLRFWKKGGKIYFPKADVYIEMPISGKANYSDITRVVSVDNKSSTNDIRHELAHAWDHLQLFKKKQLKRLDDLKTSEKIEEVLSSKKKFHSEKSSKIKKAFKSYKKKLGAERGRASGEMMRLFGFENLGTKEGHSLASVQDFYAEGYSVFHGGDNTAKAKLLVSALELYNYLEKEAKQFKLNVPDRSKLEKIKIP